MRENKILLLLLAELRATRELGLKGRKKKVAKIDHSQMLARQSFGRNASTLEKVSAWKPNRSKEGFWLSPILGKYEKTRFWGAR